MDMRKFTEKSLTAVQGAQSLAKEYGNQEIGQLHLLHALVSDQDGLIRQLFIKMNKPAEIQKLPKVQAGSSTFPARLRKAWRKRKNKCKKWAIPTFRWNTFSTDCTKGRIKKRKPFLKRSV